ncbi:hypothetical protein V8E55_007369 [Tylopilus felleus]
MLLDEVTNYRLEVTGGRAKTSCYNACLGYSVPCKRTGTRTKPSWAEQCVVMLLKTCPINGSPDIASTQPYNADVCDRVHLPSGLAPSYSRYEVPCHPGYSALFWALPSPCVLKAVTAFVFNLPKLEKLVPHVTHNKYRAKSAHHQGGRATPRHRPVLWRLPLNGIRSPFDVDMQCQARQREPKEPGGRNTFFDPDAVWGTASLSPASPY